MASDLRHLTSNVQPQTSKIGVLGGTFDPPHNGHLVIAQEALMQLELAHVLFTPTRQPPHKYGNAITPIEHRLKMVALAIAPFPKFAISRVDADRTGPTFTVDTMRLLREQLGDTVELFFIMGMDSLASILTWRTPEQLIQLCKLAVFQRPGFSVKMSKLEQKLPGLSARVVFLQSSVVDIAASDLQRRVRKGQSIAQWVPEMVAQYIAEERLYRE